MTDIATDYQSTQVVDTRLENPLLWDIHQVLHIILDYKKAKEFGNTGVMQELSDSLKFYIPSVHNLCEQLKLIDSSCQKIVGLEIDPYRLVSDESALEPIQHDTSYSNLEGHVTRVTLDLQSLVAVAYFALERDENTIEGSERPINGLTAVIRSEIEFKLTELFPDREKGVFVPKNVEQINPRFAKERM